MSHTSARYLESKEGSPATFNVSNSAYKDLDFSNRSVGDDVTFVLKGRVTSVSEDYEDKDSLDLTIEVEIIEDHSKREGLDRDGRVN